MFSMREIGRKMVPIRFENIKAKVGSRVVWDDRHDLFTPEAASLLRSKLAERTVLVFPRLWLRV